MWPGNTSYEGTQWVRERTYLCISMCVCTWDLLVAGPIQILYIYIYIFKRTPTHITYYMIYCNIYIYIYTLHLLIMPYRSMHIASYFSAAASTLPPWGCGTSERLWPERWTMRSRLTSKVAGRCAGTRNPVWFWSHIYPIEVCIHDRTWHNIF